MLGGGGFKLGGRRWARGLQQGPLHLCRVSSAQRCLRRNLRSRFRIQFGVCPTPYRSGIVLRYWLGTLTPPLRLLLWREAKHRRSRHAATLSEIMFQTTMGTSFQVRHHHIFSSLEMHMQMSSSCGDVQLGDAPSTELYFL